MSSAGSSIFGCPSTATFGAEAASDRSSDALPMAPALVGMDATQIPAPFDIPGEAVPEQVDGGAASTIVTTMRKKSRGPSATPSASRALSPSGRNCKVPDVGQDGMAGAASGSRLPSCPPPAILAPGAGPFRMEGAASGSTHLSGPSSSSHPPQLDLGPAAAAEVHQGKMTRVSGDKVGSEPRAALVNFNVGNPGPGGPRTPRTTTPPRLLMTATPSPAALPLVLGPQVPAPCSSSNPPLTDAVPEVNGVDNMDFYFDLMQKQLQEKEKEVVREKA